MIVIAIICGHVIEAVASYEDPNTYEDLKNHLIYGHNREATYNQIKNLPGIDLTEAIHKAWNAAKYGHEWEATRMALIAIEWGSVDAIGYAIDALKNKENHHDKQRIFAKILTRISQVNPCKKLRF